MLFTDYTLEDQAIMYRSSGRDCIASMIAADGRDYDLISELDRLGELWDPLTRIEIMHEEQAAALFAEIGGSDLVLGPRLQFETVGEAADQAILDLELDQGGPTTLYDSATGSYTRHATAADAIAYALRDLRPR